VALRIVLSGARPRGNQYREPAVLDKVIVTGLLMIAAVVAGVVVMMTIVPSVSRNSQSMAEAQQKYTERTKTRIKIITIVPRTNGVQVDAWVKNTGVASIIAIDRSDVFLMRIDGAWAEAMTYDSGAGGSKTWSGDLTEWNRGDTLHITIDLTNDPLTAGNYLLRVSTPNGTISEHIFEVTA